MKTGIVHRSPRWVMGAAIISKRKLICVASSEPVYAYDGLRVVPCFPADWEEAEMTRHFRGEDYHIVIRNPKHLESGAAEIMVDGRTVSGTVLPDFGDSRKHEVEVFLK